MKIQKKMVFGASFLVAISLVVSATIIGYTTIQKVEEALSEAAYQKLEAVSSSSATAIENYFFEIKHQIQSMSDDPKIIEVTKSFQDTYSDYSRSTTLPSVDEMKASLMNYYDAEYGQQYQSVNGESINTTTLINALNENSLALQYQYISANPNPLGGKDTLDAANDGSVYSEVHGTIHPYLRDFLYHFGFYDIFIADANTGHIIYSVFKELDYATSLKDGSYANSGIGEAFKEAIKSSDKNDTYLTDFASYTPSYEAAASFMSSPIYDNGKIIAVLIFQMPVEKINNLMTHHEKWSSVGLGSTGESILVGQDKTPRSISRELIEDKSQFIKRLSEAGADSQTLRRIEQMESNMLLQQIDNPAVNAALNGQLGRVEYTKYTGENVLVAYEPVELLDQRWALLAEINTDEALSAQETVVSNIITSAVMASVLALLAAVAAVIVFAYTLVKPLKNTTEIMKDLSQGDGDLTVRLDNSTNDEIGDLSQSFNEFINKIQQLMLQVEDQVQALTSTSSVVTETANANRKGADRQQNSLVAVQNSMRELNQKANEVVETSGQAEKAATDANDAAKEGSQMMQATSAAINNVAEQVEQAMTIIKELESSSESIGSVVGVISGIAEQTNLLALNAAIEAARAGEQGRGFAVVADEVRALASRTQESTLEINAIVEKLQQNSDSAVNIMTLGHQSVNESVEKADNAKQTLESILVQIKEMGDMNVNIASSAEQQNILNQAVNNNVDEIKVISTENSDCANTLTGNSDEMKQSIDSLQSILHNFKLR